MAVEIVQTLQKIGLAELLPCSGAVRQLVVRIEPPVLAQFLAKMLEKDLFLHKLVVGIAFFGAFALGFVQNDFAHTQALRRDFQVFVLRDELHVLLQ